MTGERRHFSSMDLLRGTAAFGVLMYHSLPRSPVAMPGGYLAVDLFFILSGFVIAHAYEARLRDGMDLRDFLIRRAIRLWPMLAVGAVLAMVLHGGHVGMLVLMPQPAAPTFLFPANPPLWSLLFELFAYVAFALAAPHLNDRVLTLFVLASALALGIFTLAATLPDGGQLKDFGSHWSLVVPGLARIAFGFSMGVLLHRWHCRRAIASRVTMLAWLLPAALVGVFMAAPHHGGPWALAAILLALPLIAWLATRWECPSLKTAQLAGDTSYPLYCIHMPIIAWLGPDASESALPYAVLIFGSLALDRLVDRPARRWLTGLAKRPQTRIGIST
ncbi:MAG: acyltransferase [Croceibacterium sp.]